MHPIVLFYKIRENKGKSGRENVEQTLQNIATTDFRAVQLEKKNKMKLDTPNHDRTSKFYNNT
jgi:hypothetical protein